MSHLLDPLLQRRDPPVLGRHLQLEHVNLPPLIRHHNLQLLLSHVSVVAAVVAVAVVAVGAVEPAREVLDRCGS